MQLKRYNALTTRTVHRPTRGETANEVTASRFSVDPATEVFQSPPLALQQTGGGIAIWRERGRQRDDVDGETVRLPFLSLFLSSRKLPASIFASFQCAACAEA